MQLRLPWLVTSRIEAARCAFDYYASHLRARLRRADDRRHIHFFCGFHGRSGGSEALSGIANLLSAHYRVSFQIFPTSPLNRWLRPAVGRTMGMEPDADLYLCDRAADPPTIRRLTEAGKPVLASVHGFPDSLHGLPAEQAQRALELATHLHFVSEAQADAFGLSESRFTIISNFTDKIDKAARTDAVGIVGYLDRPEKNAARALEAALGSKASAVHVWGPYTAAGADPRVRVHGWEADQQKIFGSFDVLISLSRNETFGRVVAQAMSAGSPCVLSNIPAFRPFSRCAGVTLVDPDDIEAAARAIDRGLRADDATREAIRRHWQDHYSLSAVEARWLSVVARLV